MKILYYDCFSGISGDMNLGALVDLGVDGKYLAGELLKLQLDAEYQITIRKDAKKGINGTKVDVILTHQGHNHEHEHHHHHRNLQDIENIINGSSLSDAVKKSSLDMFMRIAQAEAKVHGKSIHEVHFHEVGAVDSIVDLVGAAIALDYLKVDKIMASPVQVGGGFVKCAHGLIPVPAPATVEILKGIPIQSGMVPFETTTPTGAAILAANVEEFTNQMAFSVEKIGYGLGTRDLEIPNVLRVYLGRTEASEATEEQYLLETNIDDMNPELYSYVEERLFENGALDVYKTPIIMKKGRPAIKLSILVNKEREKEILDVIFRETTSLGIRKVKVEKMMLDRNFSTIETPYGPVTIKKSCYTGKEIKYKAEYEDCKKIAKANNIPITKVYREVDKAMEKMLPGKG
ncbi:nickel pincer cofactor biosynthesis protein LarC [Desulforamulus ruminis]|uniref:Pyridinium-3,5-bisthiocarboxylic acid mononucleotide nickel insertion protein n=1 Tax=Desulforamulus ruminis (strain ATCC 23193 / DSM 2154 / NCIMB 8452 / DL) TaxID=696281 RepID=F6DR30_DESRL|nr:nickel pincer cofactor biosynthesis protein LarC [Desulforamulus ruminis]AEG59749.1 protein of unknown function DUF111 [Desulforamulus ruminis DSM 2154]